MSHEILLEGEGGKLDLLIQSYERVMPESIDDANWLSCTATADVTGFSCILSVTITTQELRDFSSQLELVLDGRGQTAGLHTLEEAIRVVVERQRTGTVTVDCALRRSGMPEASLSFRFESDLAVLDRMSKRLRECVLAFPVISQV